MSVPRVLVTGCAGYIGSVLVGHLLKAGCAVIGVDKLIYDNGQALLPYLSDSQFRFFQGDVTDPTIKDYLHWCDCIIPLAALVGAPLCEREPARAKAVNYHAVKTLVDAASPHQLIVYPNTNSGYGQTDGSRFCTEDDPLTPISVYGRTKCDAEKAVLDHPNSVSLRLATVFGSSPRMRMDLMVNHFTAMLCRIRWQRYGESAQYLEIFEPHFKRNFVGVQDVARAFVFVLCQRWMKGAYNLGLSSANMTKMELAHTICDTIGLSRKAVQVGEGQDPDQRNYLVSNSKILHTGFQFRHELVEGIREVEQVYRLMTPEQLKQMRNA